MKFAITKSNWDFHIISSPISFHPKSSWILGVERGAEAWLHWKKGKATRISDKRRRNPCWTWHDWLPKWRDDEDEQVPSWCSGGGVRCVWTCSAQTLTYQVVALPHPYVPLASPLCIIPAAWRALSRERETSGKNQEAKSCFSRLPLLLLPTIPRSFIVPLHHPCWVTRNQQRDGEMEWVGISKGRKGVSQSD